ncbi:serine hydroxymethyltransferase [Streptomyces sp. NPDC005009]
MRHRTHGVHPSSPAPDTAATPLVAGLLRAGLTALAETDTAVLKLAEQELEQQRGRLNLVAASSPTLPAVQAAQALGLSAVTAEGYPGRRFHPGTESVDEIERLATGHAESLFGADHANVQPLSGSSANLALLYGLSEPGRPVLAMDLTHGGHLSHLARPASASRHLKAAYYRVADDGRLDLDDLRRQARAVRPNLIICGGSAYPRFLDFAAFRSIADEVGALLMADISHVSGLVAAGLHPSPVPHCDVVTTSTYKQLCGPRGGLILRGPASGVTAATVDRLVFPGFQGTADFGAIAAKAVAFAHARRPEFRTAMERVTRFARIFAEAFTSHGLALVGGGTDTHMVLVDLGSGDVTGRSVSDALERVGILANKNLVPNDPRPAHETSGLRIGTNHLAFLPIDDQDVRDLADAVAAAVADLRCGGTADRSPAWHRLGSLASALADAREPAL